MWGQGLHQLRAGMAMITDRDIRQVRAAMIYALLVTKTIDPANQNSGYNWLSSEQPETPQKEKVDLTEVCGGSGWCDRPKINSTQ